MSSDEFHRASFYSLAPCDMIHARTAGCDKTAQCTRPPPLPEVRAPTLCFRPKAVGAWLARDLARSGSKPPHAVRLTQPR